MIKNYDLSQPPTEEIIDFTNYTAENTEEHLIAFVAKYIK